MHYAPNVGVILPLGPSKSLKGEHQGRFTAFEVGVKLTQLAVVGGRDRPGPSGPVADYCSIAQQLLSYVSICTYVLHNIASAAACGAGDDWTPESYCKCNIECTLTCADCMLFHFPVLVHSRQCGGWRTFGL